MVPQPIEIEEGMIVSPSAPGLVKSIIVIVLIIVAVWGCVFAVAAFGGILVHLTMLAAHAGWQVVT